MRRKRVSRTAEDWKRIVQEWNPEKQTQRAYCGERDVTMSSFIRWRKRLGRLRAPKADGPFVAVGRLPATLAGPAVVLRFPDGSKLELSRMPDPTWVREVLRSS